MLAVTGANGHIGVRLLEQLAPAPVRALVRSEAAAGRLRRLEFGERVDVRQVSYQDPEGLAAVLAGCTQVVHLVGIIKETATTDFHSAHEESCEALEQAARQAGLEQIVYLSIVGADRRSANECLASRGEAEQVLLEGAVPATVVRVPMVLGENDYAAAALRARAHRGWNLVLRGSSLEQPIYAGDVVAAVRSALGQPAASRCLELAGPECLTRTALIQRAAALIGRQTRVVSLPVGVGMAMAFLLERISASPPVSRAMLGVLDHDDRVDVTAACTALGVELTPLDEMLRRCLAAGS